MTLYRMNRISGYQLCQFLDMPSSDDLDGFLKRHGVPLEYTIEDFEREGATSARLWQKRQADGPPDPNGDRRPVIVVADASPLRYLFLIEEVRVLPALYGRVIVPPAVVTELVQQRTPDIVRGCRLNPSGCGSRRAAD